MKRGFTLVEMLVILSALAIMFLIVVPEMSNVSRRTKENEYQRFLSDVFLSTEAFIQKNIEKYPNLNFQNKKVYVYFDELLNSGYLKSTILDPKNNKSVKDEDFTVQVFVDENNEYKYKLYEQRYFCPIEEGTEYVFDYKNGEQEFIAECDGTYKLETWGAQGGSVNSTYYGGYGAYSVGNINLEKNKTIYINVGGAGSSLKNLNASTTQTVLGGYNGGGTSVGRWGNNDGWNTVQYNGSGGGATHIAADSGLLSSLNDNLDSIYIVSAGGGSATYFYRDSSQHCYSVGGHGGGITGGKYTISSIGSLLNDYLGEEILPTQSAPGSSTYGTLTFNSASFGMGGTNSFMGGGAGLYGGSNSHVGGSGGSSYIGNSLLTDKSMYCYNCEESTEESTITISTTGTNELLDKTSCPTGYSSDPISKCAKAGNGYAKITYLGN